MDYGTRSSAAADVYIKLSQLRQHTIERIGCIHDVGELFQVNIEDQVAVDFQNCRDQNHGQCK